jgi:pheromone a factor receptor
MPTYEDLSYLYPLYPIVGAIACILCAIPIPAHWRAGNVATIMLGLWVLGMNIMFWIGTIVWHGNIENPYPIWGDIVNFYLAMFPTALASTTLCIQYRLWSIARARSVFITKKDVRIYHL